MDLDLDLLAVAAIEVEDGWDGRLANEADLVYPEIVELEARPPHAGDVEAAPGRRKTGEHHPIGTGEDRAGEEADAEVETLGPSGDMEAEVHGPEVLAYLVAPDLVETGGCVDIQGFLGRFHVIPPP